MRLGKGDADAEHFDTYGGAEREAGQEAAAVGRHVGTCLVIISEAYAEVLAPDIFCSENEMSEKV